MVLYLAAELRGAEMANPSVEIRLGNDDCAALDMVMDEIDAHSVLIVHVIKRVSEIRRNLHSRHPGRKHGEVRVPRVAEAIGEVTTGDEVVNEVDMVTGDRRAEKLHDVNMVAAADDGE